MPNLSEPVTVPATAFRLTTTGEQLRALINLRSRAIERQRAVLTVAIISSKEQIVELEKTARESAAAAQKRLDRGVTLPARMPLGLPGEQNADTLGDLRAQSYDLSTGDLYAMGFSYNPIGREIAGLVTRRY